MGEQLKLRRSQEIAKFRNIFQLCIQTTMANFVNALNANQNNSIDICPNFNLYDKPEYQWAQNAIICTPKPCSVANGVHANNTNVSRINVQEMWNSTESMWGYIVVQFDTSDLNLSQYNNRQDTLNAIMESFENVTSLQTDDFIIRKQQKEQYLYVVMFCNPDQVITEESLLN